MKKDEKCNDCVYFLSIHSALWVGDVLYCLKYGSSLSSSEQSLGVTHIEEEYDNEALQVVTNCR